MSIRNRLLHSVERRLTRQSLGRLVDQMDHVATGRTNSATGPISGLDYNMNSRVDVILYQNELDEYNRNNDLEYQAWVRWARSFPT